MRQHSVFGSSPKTQLHLRTLPHACISPPSSGPTPPPHLLPAWDGAKPAWRLLHRQHLEAAAQHHAPPRQLFAAQADNVSGAAPQRLAHILAVAGGLVEALKHQRATNLRVPAKHSAATTRRQTEAQCCNLACSSWRLYANHTHSHSNPPSHPLNTPHSTPVST